MVTGETDVTERGRHLNLGWDGRVLQWSTGQKGKVLEMGEESVSNVQGLKSFCGQLREKNFGNDAVLFHFRHPFFTVAPTAVAKGYEDQFMELQLGVKNESESHQFFYSDAFGDELVLMERWDTPGLRSELQQIWPHIRFESGLLRWLETIAALSRACKNPIISVDIGTHRALLARVNEGKLLWAMVSEDLEGEGLLYHIVNALHRDGLEPASSGAKVLLSGEVKPDDSWFRVFGRFFNQVEMASSDIEVPGINNQGWILHTNLNSCV